MSSPDYTLETIAGGAVDVGLDDIRVKELAGLRVTELPPIRVDGSLVSLPKIVTESVVTMGLDNIRVKELPKVQFEVSAVPTRVHLPSHYKLCGVWFGIEVFSLSFCGESQMINEPYVPRRTEGCY